MRPALLVALVLSGCARVAATPPALSRAEKVAVRAAAQRAYDSKDFASCGPAFERGGDPYNAACCYALAGDAERAFAQLTAEAKRGRSTSAQLEQDTDLAALKKDPRWAGVLKAIDEGHAQRLATLNAELARIFEADQADRQGQIDWAQVKPRDEAREKRVEEILAAGEAKVAADFFHAAMVFQHGSTPAHAQRAHDLSMQALKLDDTHDGARWLAAASLDRKLMYEGKPQHYGTQFRTGADGKWVLWDVEPATTDAERAEWNVPPLAEQRKRAEAMNRGEVR